MRTPKTARFALKNIILANTRRIQSAKLILRECNNLIIPQQLIDDIMSLIVATEEYNTFLREIDHDISRENNFN